METSANYFGGNGGRLNPSEGNIFYGYYYFFSISFITWIGTFEFTGKKGFYCSGWILLWIYNGSGWKMYAFISGWLLDSK